MSGNYKKLVDHYEACLDRHGDSHRGVDWPRQADAEKRYEVMLGVMAGDIRKKKALLDFGCGAAHLLGHIRRTKRKDIVYIGADLSPKFIELSRKKFPDDRFLCLDVLKEPGKLPRFDYAVANGVFTLKGKMGFEEMFGFMSHVTRALYSRAGKGIAFNVMSKQVDWENKGLFHVPFDRMAGFIAKELSRDFVLRHDYGLYEYTAYVYKRNKK